MATFLDVGILQSFDVVFAFIFVFAVMFALLQKIKIIGDSLAVNAIISVAIAFMVILSRTLVEIINTMIPWFVVAIIFFLLLVLIFMVLGTEEKDIGSVVKNNPAIFWAILSVAVTIAIGSAATVLGQSLLVEGSGEVVAQPGELSVAGTSFGQNILATLIHPKVLGILVLFGVAFFAVLLICGKAS